MSDNKTEITLVTGNVEKLKEVKQCLAKANTIKVIHEDIDLPEIQGEPEEVARHKCNEAFKIMKRPVIVEDTSLCFNALGGLPGPYVKWFLKKIGTEGLHSLLAGFDDKAAQAKCLFAYKENEKSEVKVIEGVCHGKIVAPRGENNFGWDPCFQPENYVKTFAEMAREDKNQISHRAKALKNLEEYFCSKK